MRKERILAIIPARSGSKGLPNKNIKELCGKPLIAHTINTAKKSKIFDTIMVSTDSQLYAEVAKKYGADVPFLRENVLATDIAVSVDVAENVLIELKKTGKEYEYFILLQPTSPLRVAKDIIDAMELLRRKQANSIISVCEVEHSPLWTNTLKDNLKMSNFIGKEVKITRRQDLPKYYRINGAIFISKVDHFIKDKDWYGEKSFAFIMNEHNSIDIDTELDFLFAELLMKKREEN